MSRAPLDGRTLVGAGLGLVAGFLGYRLWAAWSGAVDPERVGYPPLATPKPLADDLWIVDDTIVAGGMRLPIRMTVIRLADGGLLLHSPTPFTLGLKRDLDALGPVRHLVAPSYAHWLNLRDWQRACPDATTWAAPGVREREQVRASATQIDHELGDEPPGEWTAEIVQGVIPGGRGFHECWLFHRPSRTLLLCDLIENLEPARLPPLTRLAARAAVATRGTTAAHVRAVVRLGGGAAKEAVRAMLTHEPDRVILAHGGIFEDDAATRLRKAFAWLV